MLVKVCGMRNPENISQVAALGTDFMGFIFYPGSKRFVGEHFDTQILLKLKPGIKTVGVFVNEQPEKIIQIITRYSLDYVQLHGSETPKYCESLKANGITIFKAFGIHENFNWDELEKYQDSCEYFLFDTSSANHGGTGVKFNWKFLENYTLHKPFLLSGGIGPEDADLLKNLSIPGFAGVDLNSKFEIEPALKDNAKLKSFLHELKK